MARAFSRLCTCVYLRCCSLQFTAFSFALPDHGTMVLLCPRGLFQSATRPTPSSFGGWVERPGSEALEEVSLLCILD